MKIDEELISEKLRFMVFSWKIIYVKICILSNEGVPHYNLFIIECQLFLFRKVKISQISRNHNELIYIYFFINNF